MRPGFQSSQRTYRNPIIEIPKTYQSHTNRLVKLQSRSHLPARQGSTILRLGNFRSGIASR
jgi:hypothetical protein